jgi:hypothetical protein
MAEGARFELAVHEVDAGFQDRWFQPLTHPSEMMELVGYSRHRKTFQLSRTITIQRKGYKMGDCGLRRSRAGFRTG